MEVALIPPFSQLKWHKECKFNLALPQLMNNAEYFDSLANRDSYLIMDNGAAETSRVDPNALVQRAEELLADELAIPDELYNAPETAILAERFLKVWGTHAYNKGIKLGLVAQGTSLSEAWDLIQRVVDGPKGYMISVIYLPRLLLTHSKWARIELAQIIANEFGQVFEIHLFGSSNVWKREVLAASIEAEFIRSIDTSLPFSATMAGIVLAHSNSEHLKIERPPAYFEVPYNEDDEVLLERNIATYRMWANRGQA